MTPTFPRPKEGYHFNDSMLYGGSNPASVEDPGKAGSSFGTAPINGTPSMPGSSGGSGGMMPTVPPTSAGTTTRTTIPVASPSMPAGDNSGRVGGKIVAAPGTHMMPSRTGEADTREVESPGVTVVGERMGGYQYGYDAKEGSDAAMNGVSHGTMMGRIETKAQAAGRTAMARRGVKAPVPSPLSSPKSWNPVYREAHDKFIGQAAPQVEDQFVQTAQYATTKDGTTYRGQKYREDQPLPSKQDRLRERVLIGSVATGK